VARYPAFGLEVDDSGVLVDVDTTADLEQLRRAVRGPDDRQGAQASTRLRS